MSNQRQFSTEEARSVGAQLNIDWSQIDWAHLKEIRDYYTRLDQMEAEAESQARI
jgi:hypothetical protein